MIKYNYHTHTKRCGHAIGEDEEYVLNAIKAGIKVLGFSDHVMIRGLSQPGTRGEYEELDDYINSISYLKEKYKNQIEIHIGFEAEYDDALYDYYKELLDSGKIEYLILGQHFSYDKDNNYMNYYFKKTNDISYLYAYKDAIIKGIRSGLFKYLCHPDICCTRFDKSDINTKTVFKEIIEECVKYDMPMEINLYGFRKKHMYNNDNYPTETFFSMVSEYKNAKVILGIDAHDPLSLIESCENEGEEYIKKFKLNKIERLDL